MKRLAIGLCTVSSRKTDYLEQTLRSLLQNMSEDNREDIVINVFNCNPAGVTGWPAGLLPFSKQVQSGQIEYWRIDQYPIITNLQRNFGDSEERVRWRTKQCFDFSMAFKGSHGSAEHYMHIEDDVIACKDYDKYVIKEIENNPDFGVIRMAETGFIGLVFQNRDLLKMHYLLNGFMDEMPCDWLLEHFIQIKVRTGKKYIVPKYSIFQHIGYDRTLEGSVQPIKFRNFVGDFNAK